jgi:hypothetical protein
MVETLHPSGGFAGSLNGWQQESDQHADDRNDDEKFNECEPLLLQTPAG